MEKLTESYLDYLHEKSKLSYIRMVKKMSFTGKAKTALGWSVIVGSIAYGGYEYYKNYLSGAARACSNTFGLNKEICMIEYRIKAMDVRIKYLKDNINKCDSTNNPAKCQHKILRELIRLEKRKLDLIETVREIKLRKKSNE